jgi:hypothetical protein
MKEKTASGSTGRPAVGRFGTLALGALVAVAAAARAQATETQTRPMVREREIALALSACPQSAAGGAAVYVLEKNGYVKVRDSGNGFTAIVQHSLPAAQEPRCMDAEGTRTHLARILKVAELRAQGKSAEEIKRLLADALARGVLQAPTRPGVDYMLSTENVVTVDEEKGIVRPFPPHVMFYAPYLTNADFGSDGKPSSPIFVVAEGTPYALVIVPVGTHGAPSHAPEKAAGGEQ